MTPRQKNTLIWVVAGGLLACVAIGRMMRRHAGLDGFDAALATTASAIRFGLIASWLNWPPLEFSETREAMAGHARSRNQSSPRRNLP
jgi:hypothetical protein